MLQLIDTADTAVPATLANLSSLQYCYLDVSGMDAVAPLPAGPWLASLRWLHYSAGGLASSTAVLRAATSLEFVETDDGQLDWGSLAATGLFTWLASHPPLRRVRFDFSTRHSASSGFFVTLRERLCLCRPGLEVSGGVSYGDDADAGMYELMISMEN